MNIEELLSQKSSRKRVLIVPDQKNASRLIRKCNLKGIPRFNTEIKTLAETAAEAAAKAFAEKGEIKRVTLLDNNACVLLMYDLLTEKRPSFLPESAMSTGTAEEVLNALNKIRSGCPTEEYKNDTSEKAKAVKALIEDYENALREKSVFDNILLLSDTLGYKDNTADYYHLEYDSYTYLETEYIKRLTGEKEAIYHIGSKLPKNIHFRDAYGAENEVRFIADYIENNKLRLGDVAVYYTNTEYQNLICGVFGSKGIPFALINGYQASVTNLVSFMINILKWAENGFLYKDLKSVMASPIIDLKTEDSFAYSLYFKSVDDSLIWGLPNYAQFIKNKREEIEKSVSDKENSAQKSDEKEKKDSESNAKKLAYYDFLEDMTNVFKEDDGADGKEEKTAAEIFNDLFEFTKKYTDAYYTEKKAAYTRLKKSCETLRFYSGDFNSKADKLRFIRDYLEKMKINDTGVTNSVLAIGLSGIEVIERKYNFFIGFSANQFSASVEESPVLSDDELKAYLADDRLLSSAVNRIKQDNFINTLKTADDDTEIFISSIIYDTVNMQPATHAPVFTELSEGKTVEKADGYKDIIRKDILIRPEVTDITASEDEKIKKIVSPETDANKSISASAFATLLECPQHYFFKKVLKLPTNELKDRNSGQWLASNQKGTLCHKILERYVNEVIKKDLKNISEEYCEGEFNRIFEEEIENAKKQIAYDSEKVVKTEANELFLKLPVYLNALHKKLSSGEWADIECELHFDGAEYTVEFEDGSLTLNFHGIIDRVDIGADGQYHMTDYKTSSSKSTNNYRQHIVYPCAVKTDALPKDGKTEFSYSYILSDNEKDYSKTKKAELSDEEKTILFSAIEKNDYSATQNVKKDKYRNACKYCKYAEICGVRMGGEKI